MAQVTFYPIDNADSTLIELADGRLILKDYCNFPWTGDDDRSVRLDQELRAVLAERRRDGFRRHDAFDHLRPRVRHQPAKRPAL